MSFASPLALVCLALLPLAVLAHVDAQRRRRRYPVRFTALSTLAMVASEEPRWRRHLPFALLALALAALLVSIARPQRTVAVPVERATVVLVTDVSRSMSATDVGPTRLEAARRAAQSFIEKVPGALRVGLVAFSDGAVTLRAPTTSHKAVTKALETLQPQFGTATGAGLQTALDDLKLGGDTSVRRPPAALVLLSDGAATDRTAAFDVAVQARRQRVPIYTVALGTDGGTITLNGQVTPVPPDPAALQRIASLSGGEAFRASDADQLTAVYDRLGSQLGTEPEKREVTVLFAGAALLLLAAAMASSLALNGRLP
ncbi:MAG: Ca-activated chloride channel [Solirubrobacteraceae bacterium]|jgi:Ca-activated chloride channel family protein|nr:Ca-activated chloride channel [Solirubrobacteraceae bacterium]MEA2137648.1 Ca-activated chloride channel [Solirubrobacteraceae bacterium]